MNRNLLYTLFLLIAILPFISSCNKDSNDDNSSNKKTNQWIETNMRHWYFWYNDIPENNKLNYNAEPTDFFKSLLNKKDGKTTNGTHYYYSSINKKTTTTRSSHADEPSLGFEFQNWLIKSPSTYATNILYVLPNSPAERAGLKRGDWIHRINGANVNSTNIYDLLGTEAVQLSVMDSYEIDNTKLRTVTLTPEMIEDNPIYLTTIFQDESTQNKKVGYMVYNHFTDGYNDDSRYNEQLYTEFNNFKAEGVEEFVLDLRYNGGGLVTCAQILSWMLAPQNAVGQPFCKVVYNDVVNINNTYNIESCEANINIPRLFVLTSFRTASASEAIINGLRPFYDVILIGGTTEGKNVGSVTLSDDKYEYELHPIVCQIYNSLDNSDYADGFQPDWAEGKKELLISSHIELGDKDNDPLLREAIRRIGSGSVAHATRDASSSLPVMKRGYNSLSNKKNLGFIDK